MMACAREEIIVSETSVQDTPIGMQAQKGRLRLKFKSRFTGKAEQAVYTRAGTGDIRIVSMKRLFPFAGKFEERTRKAGLHLWYEVEFDEQTPVTRALALLGDTTEIEIAEPVYIIRNTGGEGTVPVRSAGERNSDGTAPFNDPELSRQWHYSNTGELPNSVAGADINLFAAWQKNQGSREVIVAVIDGGIDYRHEDLSGNVGNPAELFGEPGVDDDGNGYIDDIYGWNFINGTNQIEADDHGTHVAGTIGAENNNGVGVCGIAGGHGGNTGVWLLSCQLFVGINVYWFCYSTLKEWGVTFEVIDKILWNFQRTTGLFSSVLWTKLFAVVFLALSCIGTKGVKEEKITWTKIHCSLAAGVVLFFLNWWLLELPLPHTADTVFYIATLSAGYICMLMAGTWMSRLLKNNLMDDVFNTENESFQQETRLIENEYSVNLPTRFYYKKKWNNGWINVVNPFRASLVLGTPGSGKSYAVVNSYIKQQIEKGFALYCYDYKFPDLSEIAYNHLLNHLDGYKVKPKFYIINFDDPRKSHRCNPINASFMSDIADAYEASYTIMLNLNRSWISKQGDFFVESPIILLAAIIWYLRIYQGGKYCTFPHAIELLNKKYADVFTILRSYPELENYLSPFVDAWESDAQEQLQGQIASAKIPLSRMISPALYWVMTGDDFSLDINNPKEPKILVVGNNPDRQNIYSAALGLYNSRIVKLINKKGQLKSSVIIDELPTIYFRGLDNLIATARSNKVAVLLGFQDYSQLTRDYGDKESRVIQNTVGNVFSGQVVGETAKILSERFGKVLQKRQSMTINQREKSTSISTQMDSLIPASKISNLTQGMFVGAVADNFDERIEQKIFHCEIVVDNEKVKRETARYVKLPQIIDFTDKDGNDRMQEEIQANYDRIRQEVRQIVEDEITRIKNDPELCHLIKEEE